MKWTTEKPTVPGWYWARILAGGGDSVIWVGVARKGDKALIARMIGDGGIFSLSTFHSFQGPIQPEE
jgi:hypothetical protein